MTETIDRACNLISSNALSVGASAIQISGPGVLPNVVAGFVADQNRKFLRIANTHATQILFVGSTSSLTSAGVNGFYAIQPGKFLDDPVTGNIPRWIIGSGASTTATVEEYA